MKQGIHPEYVDCVVKCSCGNTFTTRSTKPELKIDICNACHPFYTGTQKLIDTGGRVQRFADRFGAAKDVVAEREAARRPSAPLRSPSARPPRRPSARPRPPLRPSVPPPMPPRPPRRPPAPRLRPTLTPWKTPLPPAPPRRLPAWS